MQSFLSRRSPKLHRAALWLLLVVGPVMIALILIRGPKDGWDYFGLILYGLVFITAAFRLIKDHRTKPAAPLPM